MVSSTVVGMGRLLLGILAVFLTAVSASAQTNEHRTAIFVINLAGAEHLDEASLLETQLKENLAQQGFSVLTAQQVMDVTGASDSDYDQTARQLASVSGALNLSQTLNADFILVANLISFGPPQLKYYAEESSPSDVTYSLRIAYGLLEPTGLPPLSTEDMRFTETLIESQPSDHIDDDLVKSLVIEAAAQIANDARETAGFPMPVAPVPPPPALSQSAPESEVISVTEVIEVEAEPAAPKAPKPSPTTTGSLVTLTIQPALDEISAPNISIGPNQTIKVSDNSYPIRLIGVAVEIDDVLRGHAPASIQVSPGLHNVQLSGYGLANWKKPVEVSTDRTIQPIMTLSAAGLAEWNQLSGFIMEIENGEAISDEEAEQLMQQANRLQASGYRVTVPNANGESIWQP